MGFAKPSTGDVIAGVSVALVAIPQSLAYAELAGLPPQYGLYATALPSLLAAAFVSSRYLQTGPVALTSLLVFGALSPIAEPWSPEYIRLAALLALLVGAMRLALGIVRLGGVAYLLSEPVITGFTTGAVIIIVSSQLPKVVDVDPSGGSVLGAAVTVLGQPDRWNRAALGFAAATAVVMLGGRGLHRLFPGVLVAVVVGIVSSLAVDYSGSTVGSIESGFIPFSLDFIWSATPDLLLPAAVIALIGFAEPAAIARSFAAADRLPWNASREMISQGVANITAGFSGAFPVGGSFSRSSLNRLAGATSAWSGAITGAFVLVFLPFTPLLAGLPRSVLGAIVIVVVIRLVDLRAVTRLLQQSPPQAMVGVGTLLATLAFAPRVERGVLVGIGLALAVHLYRELTVTVDSHRSGNRLFVAPKGVLWFATVGSIERLVRNELAEHHDITSVVIQLGGVGRLDYSGAAALSRIAAQLSAAEVTVAIAEVPHGAVRAVKIHLKDFARWEPDAQDQA